MPNTIFFIWVKNVYTQYYNWFKNSVTLYPINIVNYINGYINNVQLQVIQPVILFFNKFISTTKKTVFHLLFSFYKHNPQDLLLRPL